MPEKQCNKAIALTCLLFEFRTEVLDFRDDIRDKKDDRQRWPHYTFN